MNSKKRIFIKRTAAGVLCLLTMFSMCACGPYTYRGNSYKHLQETAIKQSDARLWTDSADRKVEIPQTVSKIAVTGCISQIVVFSLAPDKLVGLADQWSYEAQEIIPDKYLSLPVIGQLYGGKGELNLEELLKKKPDVVIDVGEPKDGIAEDMDALQKQTGIPFLHVDMTLADAGNAYRKLGELLEMEDEAEIYAQYCEEKYAEAQILSDTLGDKKAEVLYILGSDGLNVIAKESYHSEILDLLTDNLAVLDAPSSKGTGNEVDMEQILEWNPSAVFIESDVLYRNVAEMKEWQSVKAIADNRYYRVPFGPYNWMGFPPSIQRLLGMMWIEKTLYPDMVDYNLEEAVKEYYKLFYHCELTDEQYDILIKQDAFES